MKEGMLMKRIIALVLLALLLLLPACGGKDKEATNEPTTQASAYSVLTGVDKEFFDMFKICIPLFNDPSSVRVTNVYYSNKEDYGLWFAMTVNARNGFGGITPTDYFLSSDFFGTIDDYTTAIKYEQELDKALIMYGLCVHILPERPLISRQSTQPCKSF
jgi:hypothetical protein